MVLEKIHESPLDCKEIHPVHPKGNQSWIFIGRTDGEVETPKFWPPDVKNELLGKDPDTGKDWSQEEKGKTVDEMVGWHHRLDGHESEQAPEVDDGQESLACCSPWGNKESDMTEQLNWTELNWRFKILWFSYSFIQIPKLISELSFLENSHLSKSTIFYSSESSWKAETAWLFGCAKVSPGGEEK